VKYWEIIADNLSKAGWSCGCVSALDRKGRTIWIVDVHGYGKPFIVRADEIRTAFVELQSAIHGVSGRFDLVRSFLALPRGTRKSLTSSGLERHDAACVKSASKAINRPLTFFPLGETAKGSLAKEPSQTSITL
jgi:hypothetical protein